MKLSRNIFRKYDIRGTYGVNIDKDIAYIIGKSYGTYIQTMNRKICIVGQDNRYSSKELADNLMLGILSSGCDVINLGLVTTPMFSYACLRLNIVSGVMVTASHNPKDDNGFKFNFDDRGNINGKEIAKIRDFTFDNNFYEGKGNYYAYDISSEYVELMMRSISLGERRVKVVLDLGNGTTSVIAKRIFDRFNIDYEIMYGESDSNFPNHLADPSIEDNLSELKKQVVKSKADLGIGYDADGDRLGIIDEQGNYVSMDKFMIMIIRDLYNKVPSKKFIYDVKVSKSVEDEINKLGCIPVETTIGNLYSRATTKHVDSYFGGEFSGHMFFGDRFPRIDSGIYASLRLIELLSKTNKSCSQLYEGYNFYYNTKEIKIESNNDKKYEVIEDMKIYCLKKGYKCSFIDGVKAKWDDGWALIRYSNTGPYITVRFEAKTIERLNQIKEEFIKQINFYNREIEIL